MLWRSPSPLRCTRWAVLAIQLVGEWLDLADPCALKAVATGRAARNSAEIYLIDHPRSAIGFSVVSLEIVFYPRADWC
jgi:hypothetical protein